MSSVIVANRIFIEGLVVGLALAAVTVVTVGAARRVRRRGKERSFASGQTRFIDGVRPLDEALLDSRPEADSLPRRLESEAVDAPVMNERW